MDEALTDPCERSWKFGDPLPDPRPSWPEVFMAMARELAKRGDCTRRQVAAIIFDPETGDFIEAGYNGAPAGQPGCLSAGACPRGRHYPLIGKAFPDYAAAKCYCGDLWPCEQAVEPGSSYDTGPGRCIAIHAEANAQIRAGKRSRGMVMVITDDPCDGCIKIMQGARLRGYHTPTSLELCLPLLRL